MKKGVETVGEEGHRSRKQASGAQTQKFLSIKADKEKETSVTP